MKHTDVIKKSPNDLQWEALSQIGSLGQFGLLLIAVLSWKVEITNPTNYYYYCFQAKIVNTDGDIVKIGEQGELCTRGYSTMLGYWGDKEKTDSAISATRWYHTGYVNLNLFVV